MTLVSNDPSWWPAINANLISSYFIGLWRVSPMTMLMTRLILAAVSQLPPVLW
ncbi:hypothetical protein BDR05DRAFT_969505 [Suillus weaverae]|nr:hypothetical protein BDR05DRAFT_971743 [Suillus weaverae]KAG2338073.1 hypothetical protein BDR05DRAFT_969505 [Suillus weaverae]